MKTDNELIRMFQRGDAEAFRSLYLRHRDKVFFYAKTLAKRDDRAEEAVQEAFFGFIRRIRSYEAIGSFKNYLYSTIRCRIIDESRRLKLRRETSDPKALELFVQTSGHDWPGNEQELAGRVGEALLTLSEPQREVVALKVFDRMTFKEIAALMGTSENTVASRYRYGLEKLRVQLGGLLKNEGS